MLTERQSHILEFVISEHVDTAEAVGSAFIGRKYKLSVSPATIRSEMAELESQGYLRQPHTSAGRIPTGKGYRFYVERLMHEEDLPLEAQQTIRHQFHQVVRGQEALVHLAASILAQAVENAAVVTAPHTIASHIKHLELVSLHDRTVLLVLVIDQVQLKQQIFSLEEPCTQDELSATAGRLNHLFGGATVEQIESNQTELPPVERQVMDLVIAIMRASDEAGFDDARMDGLQHILSQPEFVGNDRALALLELLDGPNLTRLIPLQALALPGVAVFIGGENPRLAEASEAMRDCSIVVGAYGAPGVATGALAVLGPMRMHYSRTISTVRYLADVMSEVLAEYYE